MALAGKDGLVKIGTNTVADIKNWKVEASRDMLDNTALGSSWKTSITGLGEWTSSAEGSWVISTDTNGQTALQTAFLAGTSVALKLYVNATNYYSGTAYISSMNVEDAVDDLVTVSFEFQGSGALTYA